jgi:hypothetical protein
MSVTALFQEFIVSYLPCCVSQHFDAAKAQPKPETPSHHASDGVAWETITVIQQL